MKAPQLWLTLTQQSPANAKGPEALSTLAIGVFFLIGGAAAFCATPGPDVSLMLYAAGRVIDGARYGADIMEINPPLIVWLSMLPAFSARAIGTSHYAVLTLFTLALAGASLTAVQRMLKGYPRRALIVTALAAGFLLLPALDFAQREHIAAILCAPWLALAVLRADARQPSGRLLAFAAFIGSLGFLLKPYFLLGWLAVELPLVRRRGLSILWRAENVFLFIGGLVYVIAALMLVPDYIRLAVLLGPAYGDYLAQGRLEVFFTWLGAALSVWYRWRHPAATTPQAVLEAATVGFLLAAVSQLKWWPYHFIPALAFGLTAALLPHFPNRSGWRRPEMAAAILTRLIVAGLLIAAALRNADIIVRPSKPDNLADPHLYEMLEAVAKYAPKGPVMVLSTNIHSSFPLIPLSGVTWASRIPHLWPLTSIYASQWPGQTGMFQYHPASERHGVERWLNETLLEDFQRYRPQLIFVMRPDPLINDSGGARRVDYIAYLESDARFAAILKQYAVLNDVGRYRIFKRVE
jgi:hypothetical protein